ncbi:MAG: RDD family protein [Nannocystis sp.]|uniref:RDD family protein n=1 Tax=Nannocystis sp. TaxID=1962667 RepID=UPI002422FFD2|nr:RDD family protein [Nannocystis sp.]MBK9757142.1 RDD family protein [Nannocystis sp.]
MNHARAQASPPGARTPPLDTVAEIETPEHIRFRYQLAGPGRRMMAYLIDLAIRGIIVVILGLILQLSSYGFGFGGDGFSTGAFLLVAFAVEWGYYVLWESLWSGRTPGKRSMHLRVLKEGGYPTGFLDIALRNLLRAADFLPMAYSVGLLVMGLDPRFRRLGDMVAGTVVVVEDPGRIGHGLVVQPPPSAAELASLPARPDLSSADLEALDLFLRRVGTLNPAREQELADIIAPVYAKRLGLQYTHSARFLALLYLRAIGRTA